MAMEARRQLRLVALVQVLVMALWFSASAVVPALREEWGISQASATWLTASVQLGFVVGALASAVLNLADRVRPHVLIGICAVLGASTNLLLALTAHGLGAAIPLRFLTGVALAGVYPVGLKLMASWFEGGRGVALGVLVGALTVGSAMPQLVNALTTLPWPRVLAASSALAVVGAVVAVRWVRLGPYAGPSPPFRPAYVVEMFRDRRQRLVNIGYLGHMWELYAMWTWLPVFVAASYTAHAAGSDTRLAVGLTAFAAIGVAGAIGCLVGGRLADRVGRAEVTIVAMLASAACCVLSWPLFGASPFALVPLLLVWGAAIVADSAQFSAAMSEVADRAYVGTALTAQTALGFLLTVATIQALPLVADEVGWRATMPLLALGPLVGAAAMAVFRAHGSGAQAPVSPRPAGL